MADARGSVSTRNARRRDEIRSELEATRERFHELVGSVAEEQWGESSGNPAWSIGEVLFHIVLRLRLFSFDVSMIRRFRWVPKMPASIFNRLTVPAIKIGARNHTGRSVAESYDKAHRVALRLLEDIQKDEWEKGAVYPNWDHLLEGFVTLERLFHHPAAHFALHAEEVRKGLARDGLSQRGD
jgi:hypothetical protein